jgi:hypothetical protein
MMRSLSLFTLAVLAGCGNVHQGATCAVGDCHDASLAPIDAGNGSRDASAMPASGAGGSAATSGDAIQLAGTALAPAAGCGALSAMSSGRECLRSDGFAWNGASCDAINCGCLGADCASVDPTAAACESAHAHCDPASTCASAWYACSDVCGPALALRGGGRSFGVCASDCYFDLTLTSQTARGESACRTLTGLVRGFDSTGTQLQRVWQITLSETAWREAARISRNLAGGRFDVRSGCPDCADGGAAWIALSDAKGTLRKATYPYRAPPQALRAADAFIQALIDEAIACAGPRLDRCDPSGMDSVNAPRCGQAPVSATTCECPSDVFGLDAVACDGSCGGCLESGSTCGATCATPCNGGDPRWRVLCTE